MLNQSFTLEEFVRNQINNGEKYIFCSKTKDEDGNLEVGIRIN